MSTFVLTHYTYNWQGLANVVIPNSIDYCKSHGYGFQCFEVDNYGKYNGLIKIHQLKGLNYGDVALVMDIDASITNHLIKIESFLDNENHLYLTKDINSINTGVFILRINDWSKKLLQYIEDKINEGLDCEQNAIESWINEYGLDKIKIVDHPAFNSYPIHLYKPSYGKIGYQEGDFVKKPEHKEGAWQLGDFVLHVPALPLDKRISIMSNLPIVKYSSNVKRS